MQTDNATTTTAEIINFILCPISTQKL